MYFESFDAAFEMAGHGVFVWSAYAISFIVLAAYIMQPLVKHRRQCKQIAAQNRAANVARQSR